MTVATAEFYVSQRKFTERLAGLLGMQSASFRTNVSFDSMCLLLEKLGMPLPENVRLSVHSIGGQWNPLVVFMPKHSNSSTGFVEFVNLIDAEMQRLK